MVGTDNGENTVVLISSVLSTYLFGAGMFNSLNETEAIEDQLLHPPGFDLTVNSDGSLLSMQRAAEAPVPFDGASTNSDGFLLLDLIEAADPLAPLVAALGANST